MKTTVEIPDDLFERVQKLAQEEKTSIYALIEEALRLLLREKEHGIKELPPLVTVRGHGLTDTYKTSSWAQLRDAAYRGHGS